MQQAPEDEAFVNARRRTSGCDKGETRRILSTCSESEEAAWREQCRQQLDRDVLRA